MNDKPKYLEAHASGDLARKVDQALAHLEDCRLCPRDCRINRLEDEYAFCLSGRRALVSSAFPHFGEEDCLRGWNGSGTIFFGHCNLRCVFCQNFDISQRAPRPGRPEQDGEPQGQTAREIADMMLDLQNKGCHNINFVTPEHVVPQMIEALALAVEGGLRVPIVYNTSAYDSMESLDLLDGLVDIYMPDFKYIDPERSKKYLKADDYPEVAKEAVVEMQRQVGDLVVDDDGLARSGLIVRHLVMPGAVAQVEDLARFLSEDVSPNVYLNLMDQYYPAGRVTEEKTRDTYRELGRRLSPAEFDRAKNLAHQGGVTRFDARKPHPKMRRRFGWS